MRNTLSNIWVVYTITERDRNGKAIYTDDIEHFDNQEEAMKFFNELKYTTMPDGNQFSNDNVKIDSLSGFLSKFYLDGEAK
jgi:hypothetical protein